MNRIALAIGSCCLIALLGTVALAGKHNEKIDIGDKAPKLTAMPGVDGNEFSAANLDGKKASVIVFTCNHCPVAQAYTERFNQFATEYEGKPVGFVAVSVSLGEADDLDAMKAFAEEHEIQYPYVWDKSQASGKGFRATVTPHVFVLNEQGEVAYMGAWDDSWQSADKVKSTYVKDAVDALLAGKRPETTETLQKGCGISYK